MAFYDNDYDEFIDNDYNYCDYDDDKLIEKYKNLSRQESDYKDDLERDAEDFKEPLKLIEEDFCEQNVTEVLASAGFFINENLRYSGRMKKLVFLSGNDKEIYSHEEIRFIEQIKEVFVWSDFTKKMRCGKKMKCRVFAAKISESGDDAVESCVLFERIINKAFDGFNIFLLATDDSIFFGSRFFSESEKNNCVLSHPIQTENQYEQMIDNLMLSTDMDDFAEFYLQIVNWIMADNNFYLRREPFQDREGNKFLYSDDIQEIPKISFKKLLIEIQESLSFVKSNRIDTSELLLEVNTMLQNLPETGSKNNQFV